jgi:MFS family permease
LVSAIGFALNAPLFALTMDDRGMDAMVGLLMTIAGVAALVCTPVVPWLMARFLSRSSWQAPTSSPVACFCCIWWWILWRAGRHPFPVCCKPDDLVRVV